MAFTIVNPGMLALLQDYGRYGFQHIGVTTGGPLDEHAFLWANRLLGNRYDAAQIEITAGMLSLDVSKATNIALTGADMGATLNGQPLQPWQTCPVRPGDRLEFATARSGLRAYLAVSGGFDLTCQLGSASTVMREGIGGLASDGGKLSAGNQLEYSAMPAPLYRRMGRQFIPDYDAPLTLDLIPGYQYESFSAADRARFFSSEYQISGDIDRMGYRLSGPAVHSTLDGIISEGISFGAVQIPKDGQPIVLLRDRQTIGGYPKIGCVTSLDAARLAQRGPGTRIRFALADAEQAAARRIIYNRFFGIGQ